MAGWTTEAVAERLLGAEETGYAPWLDRQACRRVIDNGLPGPRSEPWKYTNVLRWYETALSNSAPAGGETLLVDAPRGVELIRFSDNRAQAIVETTRAQAIDLASQPLAAINGLLLGAGIVIRAPRARQTAQPVRIEALGAAFQQVRVLVEDNASLTLIEEPSTFTHRIVEIAIARGGRLRHLRRQAAARNRECSLVGVHLEAGASYALSQISFGADLRRNDVQITLAGEGAEATVASAWRLDGRRHLDNQVALNHALGGGFSRQTYRGVVDDHARAVLNGRIHIAPGANGADASLTTKNLLAHATAEVYAKPELEIHASDVRCSHGASVGALDEDAIHYLRCRGVGEEAARNLLIRGFLREAVEDDEGARRLGLFAALERA